MTPAPAQAQPAVNDTLTPRRRGGTPRRRAKGTVETADYVAMTRRILRALGRRVGQVDLAELPALAGLAAELDGVLGDAARRLHDDCGYSWAEIGRELGVSRQAAQQRFGRM